MNAMIFAAAAASRPLGVYGVIMIAAIVTAGLILAKLLASRRGNRGEALPPAAVPEKAVDAPVQATSLPAGKIPAKGSLGEVDLNSVNPRTAAMLMAIVADKIGAPLNTLRFISIKEVGE